MVNDINAQLSEEQKRAITTTSYYHLKHYGELSVPHEAEWWINKLSNKKEEAGDKIGQLIEEVRKQEIEKLNLIFSSQADDTEIQRILDEGSRAATIEDKMKKFNELLKTVEYDDTNTYTRLFEIIQNAFMTYESEGFEKIEAKTKKQYYTLASQIMGVEKALENGVNQYEEPLKSAVMAVCRKLNGAARYYATKSQPNKTGREQLNDVFKKLDIGEYKGWNPSHHTDVRALDGVQLVANDSGVGYLNAQGGAMYEKFVKSAINNSLVTAGLNVTQSNVVGNEKDSFKKQQKTDVTFTFTIPDSNLQESHVLNFSVKKNASGSIIDFHHGGGILSYAKRFESIAETMHFTDDWNIFNNGSFQYIYVNEISSNPDLIEAVKDYLRGAGYLFLGERINKDDKGAADFVWIGGEAYAFSTILERIQKDNNESGLKVRVIPNKTTPIEKKAEAMKKYTGFYSKEFIEASAKAGKTAIAGTKFSIQLLKSAYNP